MSEVTKENIATVTDALNEYLERLKASKENTMDIVDFVKFMNPKFVEAGYRHLPKIPRQKSRQTNILLIHDTSAGDFILLSPAIREIRRVYPKAKIKLFVSISAENLAELCPYVDEVISFDDSKHFQTFADAFEFSIEHMKKFLTERIDICYAFGHFPYTSFMMFMSGAKERICFRFDRESYGGGNSPFPLQNDFNFLATISAPPFLYGHHHVDCNMSLLDFQLGAPVVNRRPEIWCNKADMETAKNIFQGREENFYAFNMGGSAACKKYPPKKYADFIKMILQEEPDANFLIIGGGEEDLKSAEIFRESIGEEIFSKHFIDATNKLTYRQSAAAISLCKFYIGNDTGTMHAAAAVQRPILAVFSFPADLPVHLFDTVRAYRPYNTPSVVIQPAKALPECRNSSEYSQYGCKITGVTHCIAQIEPETLLKGFHTLKDLVEKKSFKTVYLS